MSRLLVALYHIGKLRQLLFLSHFGLTLLSFLLSRALHTKRCLARCDLPGYATKSILRTYGHPVIPLLRARFTWHLK